jgi:hypothetical protein
LNYETARFVPLKVGEAERGVVNTFSLTTFPSARQNASPDPAGSMWLAPGIKWLGVGFLHI